MMPSTMKHLLSGVAVVAALAIAVPVWAQTQPAPYTQPAPPQTYAQPAPPQTYAEPKPYKERHAYRKHHKRYAGHTRTHYGRGSRAPQDNIANQLNAQELGRVGGGPAPRMGGPYGGGYGQPSPRQGGGYGDRLMAPGTLGGGYGQPAPTQGIPGGNQPSASSHPPY
jgi:hypothetical protein